MSPTASNRESLDLIFLASGVRSSRIDCVWCYDWHAGHALTHHHSIALSHEIISSLHATTIDPCPHRMPGACVARHQIVLWTALAHKRQPSVRIDRLHRNTKRRRARACTEFARPLNMPRHTYQYGQDRALLLALFWCATPLRAHHERPTPTQQGH